VTRRGKDIAILLSARRTSVKQWTGKPRPTEFKLPAAVLVLEVRRIKTE
jgi:hypothetical protein